MRFALVDNERIEAQPKLQGLCSVCSQPVIAKCGNKKVWHWAHRSIKDCDSWWEPETEWHRNWKNLYPLDWQERVLFDEQTGEKHIADVKTLHGLVIEFQHSAIRPEERLSRERFYKNMIWVVDGTRLKRDYPRFQEGLQNFRKTNQNGIYHVIFPEEVFSENWLNSSVPVIFDFSTTEPNEIRNTLWCLFPKNADTGAYIVGFKRNEFLQKTLQSDSFMRRRQDQNTQPVPAQIKKRRREPTHYLHKGKWVKRRRL
jgi:hypothetical protein